MLLNKSKEFNELFASKGSFLTGCEPGSLFKFMLSPDSEREKYHSKWKEQDNYKKKDKKFFKNNKENYVLSRTKSLNRPKIKVFIIKKLSKQNIAMKKNNNAHERRSC